MKKFYCVLSTVFLLIGLTGCKKEENKETSQVSAEITSNEKLLEVLSYLLRISDFKQYTGKTILNNVYIDLRWKSLYLRDLRHP